MIVTRIPDNNRSPVGRSRLTFRVIIFVVSFYCFRRILGVCPLVENTRMFV